MCVCVVFPFFLWCTIKYNIWPRLSYLGFDVWIDSSRGLNLQEEAKNLTLWVLLSKNMKCACVCEVWFVKYLFFLIRIIIVILGDPSPIFPCYDHTFLCASTTTNSSKCEWVVGGDPHTGPFLSDRKRACFSLFLALFSSPFWFETAFQASIVNVPNRLPLLMLQHYEFFCVCFSLLPEDCTETR